MVKNNKITWLLGLLVCMINNYYAASINVCYWFTPLTVFYGIWFGIRARENNWFKMFDKVVVLKKNRQINSEEIMRSV